MKIGTCIILDTMDGIEEKFATRYSSVIVFGKATLIEDKQEMRKSLEFLIEKYSPNYIIEGHKEIDNEINDVLIIQIEIEHISGKRNKE